MSEEGSASARAEQGRRGEGRDAAGKAGRGTEANPNPAMHKLARTYSKKAPRSPLPPARRSSGAQRTVKVVVARRAADGAEQLGEAQLTLAVAYGRQTVRLAPG